MCNPPRVTSFLVLLSLACWAACGDNVGFPRPRVESDACMPSGSLDDGGALDGGEARDAHSVSDVGEAPPRPRFARNVILFIGDGMGFPQVEAARRFANGNTRPLAMETLPMRGCMLTRNALGGVTDSAAGATAFATGRKVSNGVLSLELPGSGAPLPTALEQRQAAGAATGLVTRETSILDATPAAFIAHESSRYAYAAIAHGLFHVARPDFLAGQAGFDANNLVAAAAGYTAIAHNWDPGANAALIPGTTKLAWFYDGMPPPLSAVTEAAISFLSRGPAGFFLLVENEGTDTAGHANDLQGVVASVLELDRAVAAALAWQAGRDDTLIIVTADHETGGLLLAQEATQAGLLPRHTFYETWHTAAPVPLFAAGVGAAELPAVIDNTDLFRWLAP